MKQQIKSLVDYEIKCDGVFFFKYYFGWIFWRENLDWLEWIGFFFSFGSMESSLRFII